MNSHNSELEVIKTPKVPTATEIQGWLVDYLAQELEIQPEAIDITVTFERYGLDSSTAIVLTGELQDWLGCQLEPELLFDYQTIAELTQYIVDSGLLDSVSPIPQEIEKVKVTPVFHQSDTTGVYPLSHGQQALWFLYKLAPDSSSYNVAFTARILSEVDVAALRSAFQKLVDRHPILRTTFGERDGQPVQQVHPQQEVCFEEIDAGNWDEEQLKQEVITSYKRPFEIEQGSVLRVSLFKRSEKDYVLLINLHHIVCDGWSVWMLLDELRVLYPAEQEGNIANLPPLEFSYADYVNWQSEMLTSSEGEKLWDYWREELAGELPILNLPTDRPRPAVQTYNGASHKFTISKELTNQLKELTHDEGATLYMTLLAAFYVLLHRYTDQKDILVGSAVKCRNQTEFAGIFGLLANEIVLRADLAGNPTFKTFLHQVRHTVLGAIIHQDYPFPLLVERLQPNRDPSYSPIFQALFALQKPQQFTAVAELLTSSETPVRVDWGGLELEPFEMVVQEGQLDLVLEMLEGKESLVGAFKFNSDLFEADTIARMTAHFQTLIEGILANPDQHILDLPLLTAAEQQQLLLSSNRVQTDTDRGNEEQILAQLDELSDEEVNALLNQMLVEEQS